VNGRDTGFYQSLPTEFVQGYYEMIILPWCLAVKQSKGTKSCALA